MMTRDKIWSGFETLRWGHNSCNDTNDGCQCCDNVTPPPTWHIWHWHCSTNDISMLLCPRVTGPGPITCIVHQCHYLLHDNNITNYCSKGGHLWQVNKHLKTSRPKMILVNIQIWSKVGDTRLWNKNRVIRWLNCQARVLVPSPNSIIGTI